MINMTILSQTFPGLTCVCEGCGALLSYTAKDMYEGKYIYCTACKHKNEVPQIIDAQLVEMKKETKVDGEAKSE